VSAEHDETVRLIEEKAGYGLLRFALLRTLDGIRRLPTAAEPRLR
jgi:hypothetical protein